MPGLVFGGPAQSTSLFRVVRGVAQCPVSVSGDIMDEATEYVLPMDSQHCSGAQPQSQTSFFELKIYQISRGSLEYLAQVLLHGWGCQKAKS